jgi:thiol:disulfide interchange protein DsbD
MLNLRAWSIALLAALAMAAPAAAQFGAVDPMVDATLVSERSSVAPGETVYLALHQEITPGWHTYWRNPGDSGEATQLTLDLPAGWSAGEMVWPTPTAYPLGPLTNYGYSDAVTLPVPVQVPAGAPVGEVTIPARATWLVCEDICIPEEADLSITLRVGESRAAPAGQALIAAAIATAPSQAGDRLRAGIVKADDTLVLTLVGQALEGGLRGVRNLEIFPLESGIIDHAAPQLTRLSDGEARVDIPPGYLARNDLPGPVAFVLAYEQRAGGGWARTALQLTARDGATLNALAAPEAGGSPAPAGGASPAAGAAASPSPAAAPQSLSFVQAALFALLGGLILNLMPCVFPILSMKAITLVEKRGAERGEARVLGLIFALGVIGTFLALGGLLLVLRVAGLPDLWGVQLQIPAVVAGLALLMFLIGLNFIGVFEVGTSLQSVGGGVRDTGRRGALLTGVLAVFVAAPCLAPFMAGALAFALVQPPVASLSVFAFLGVGLAAPFVLVSFFPALLGFLPKPGPWMVRLRQALAFPMFATAIWLVWVLVAQVGPFGVIWSLAAFLAAGFALWAFSLKGVAGRVAGIAGVVLTAACVLSAARLEPVQAVSQQGGAWAEWSLEAIDAAQAQGRPVFVDFTAAWCVTCQVNKLGALSDSRVKAAFADRDVALLRADFTNRDDVIARELARHGAAGLPLYLVYPASGGAPEVLPPLLSGPIVIRALERAVAEQP